ncbi:MAG TPA: DNA-processing protein DprA [Rectinemataceae bacterium]|nr:DNA-processing protein DprA [Rectinemataceae bacterium]
MKNPMLRLLALALQRASFLRPEERLRIWDLVDDLARLSVLSLRDLETVIGRRLDGRRWDPRNLIRCAEEDSLLLEKIGARFIHHDDPDYPPLLRETAQAPFGLYVRGPMLSPEKPAVAIVGTRLPTGRGTESAEALGREFAAAGIPVISGLARGIDAAAHRGALRAPSFGPRLEGGPPHFELQRRSTDGRAASGTRAAEPAPTCAVLPCGVDRAYPPSNRGLAAAILDAGGLLLSEYPPGTEIHKYRFPERNRIIAGMARAVLVVEAPVGSGALITAAEALAEGRDLWVSKACLGGLRSGGIDRLAFEGAPALSSAAELLADWGMAAPAPVEPRPRSGSREADPSAATSTDEGRRLASSLGSELDLGSELRERALQG